MTWMVAGMKWILLLSGTLTCTMFYATLAPQAATIATFGVPLEGEAADVVVRSWGTLITLVGAMLIYGAFHPPARPLILTIAGLSKVCFIALVLSHGTRFLWPAWRSCRTRSWFCCSSVI